MADFTLSKSLFSGKYRNASSTPGNIAYALFVLFCFWAGAQLLVVVLQSPLPLYPDMLIGRLNLA